MRGEVYDLCLFQGQGETSDLNNTFCDSGRGALDGNVRGSPRSESNQAFNTIGEFDPGSG